MTRNTVHNKNQWGYLRETEKKAEKIKPNPVNGMHKTGLDTYLKVIFPNTNDWILDKIVPNCKRKTRPDYRSEFLKLIIEFNGLQHYQKPDIILKDREKEKCYTDLGYKVVQIPFFIQLTNKAVKTLFNVDVKEPLFDESIPSLLACDKCTPAYLCTMGIKRMAAEFLPFPEQYEVNINSMKKEDLLLTGWDLLEQEYNILKRQDMNYAKI